MTTFDLDDNVFGALEAGASGFVLKDAEPDELIAALLFIEVTTVKSHLTRAMAELGTRDRLQTVVWSCRGAAAGR